MNFFESMFQKALKIGFIRKIFEIPIVKKLLNKETINYLIFGVLTTIVSYGVYIIAMWIWGVSEGDPNFELAFNVSTIISWILAVAFAYITNKLYVFESKSFKLGVLVKEILAFVGARLFSLVCEVIWMNVVVTGLGMNDKLAKILANVFVIIINYFFSKFFIFKKDKKEV